MLKVARFNSFLFKPYPSRNNSVKTILIILCLIPLLCHGQTAFTVSKENAVYESIFAYIIHDVTKKINISNSTKIAWSHKYKPKAEELVEFISLSDENFLISTEMLNNLIDLNRTESVIDWKPIMVSASFDFFENSSHGKPNGKSSVRYYQVSKVAFSKDGNKALVSFTYNCVLCGSSSLIYLELIDDFWVIKGSRLLWVS